MTEASGPLAATSTDRATLWGRLTGEPGAWDVVVIGGGATGLGAALDAAARGYRVALVEAHDLAQGTSSRSTKLVHGGVRYLARGEIGLVREALRERGHLLRNAPHLVHDREFLVPAYRPWTKPYYGLGLWLYDRLAGAQRLGRTELLDRNETLQRAATLVPAGLRGAVAYRDGQFDDARLALALARSALDRGAVVLNHAPVVGLVREAGRITGVVVRDAETGVEATVRARVVVNATGVFADAVRRLDDAGAAPLLRPSQGAHLVLDRRFLPGEAAILVPRTDDGRVLFAIPWLGRVLVGTTDGPVPTAVIEPKPMAQEIAYLLDHAGRYLSPAPTAADIRSTFAGLRPLIGGGGVTSAGGTAQLSREHLVLVAPSGLVTVTGGKWTTYRRMAADAVDRAAEVAGLERRPCVTADLPLHGCPAPGSLAESDPTLAAYGSDAAGVRALMASRPELARALHPGLPYLEAEVVWAARHELARTVEDVLARRTRALFLDAGAATAAASRVAALLAAELGHDAGWIATQVAAFGRLATGYTVPGPEPA